MKGDAFEDLRWRVVANAGRGRPRKWRWAHVHDATGFGSGMSQQLCRDAGFDPDEEVGDVEPLPEPLLGESADEYVARAGGGS